MVRDRQDDDWIVDDGKIYSESYFGSSVITQLGFIMFIVWGNLLLVHS